MDLTLDKIGESKFLKRKCKGWCVDGSIFEFLILVNLDSPN